MDNMDYLGIVLFGSNNEMTSSIYLLGQYVKKTLNQHTLAYPIKA